MLGIRLEPKEKREALASETGSSQNHYAREAIRQYLESAKTT